MTFGIKKERKAKHTLQNGIPQLASQTRRKTDCECYVDEDFCFRQTNIKMALGGEVLHDLN